MKNEKLTLAGNLIFGINPQKYNKSFYIDCCYYNGNNVSVNSYISEGRKIGSFETLYDETISFIKSNLQNRQVETNFNSRGVLEIDERVLGELIINAIMHRDYRINSAIKIFIFHNRVEIISPGKLTNSLTVEKIKQGISIKRNPILDSICNMIFVYTGRGSGIKRVLEIDPSIEFINDIDKEEFKCIIPRK
jgi:predicted HTH transcriptional regulator